MSIIKDQNLINQLLKIAQGYDPETELRNIAQKMVSNLQAQLNQDSFTASRDNADLRTINLVNLDSLINFLNLNGIKYNNLNITFKYGEQLGPYGGAAIAGNSSYANLTPAQQKLYIEYPVNSPAFYVYKDGLIAYLRDLQSKNIPLLNASVNKLIEQANNLMSLEMPKVAPKEEVKLDPELLVDTIPVPLTAENPDDFSSGLELKIKDLDAWTSKSSFIDFITKLRYSKNNQPIARMTTNDVCEIINILHARAEKYVGLRDLPEHKKYLAKVNEFASQYSCQIKSPFNSANKSVQNVSYKTESGALSPAGIQAISALQLPLERDTMNFERIYNFANKYHEITKDTISSSIDSYYKQLLSQYPNFKSQDLARVNFKQLADYIFAQTKEENPDNYINLLEQLLNVTNQMMDNLLNLLRSSEGSKPVDDLRQRVEEQKTFFSNNLSYINRWKADMASWRRNLNAKR